MSVADTAADQVQRRVEFDVSGMTCAACASRVERKLNKVDGVRASVNYATRVATASVPADTTDDELCAVVENAGYHAQPRTDSAQAPRDHDSDRARDLFRRLVVCLVLFVPLADLSVTFAVVPATRFTGWQWLLLVLALPIVTWGAWPFYRAAVNAARHRTTTMDTLISLGAIAATVWSVITMFGSGAHTRDDDRGVWHALFAADSIYLEVAAGVVVFVLAGRYFEAKATSRAGGALRALAALSAKDVAVLFPDGGELRIPVAELKEEQRFVVRPGETVAADGLVIDGRAAIDMSTMTGESTPVQVEPGQKVVGGTVVIGGRLIVEAAAVGPDTQFAAMVRLVEEAQADKAGAQRLADRIAGIFVPTVIGLSLITLVAWLAAGEPVGRAAAAALAVLIIACPCALGLATPMALMVASGRGAQLGIFLKGHRALEVSRQIDTVVFDKTGTITTGELSVIDMTIDPACGRDRDEIAALAASVESSSEHAIGAALARAVPDASVTDVEDFTAVPGCGVTGRVGGVEVMVGSPRWVGDARQVDPALVATRRDEQRRGRTVVYVALEGRVCAAVVVADAVKDSAADAIAELHRQGLRTLMVTGDNAVAAQIIADEVGIGEVIAEVLPDGKVDVVAQLQAQGCAVAMVGDGINDAPALATADLGLAIGRGTDVAIGAADIILVRHSLHTVPEALGLARETWKTIRTNMIWAFGYNVAAIPIAAAGLLNPLIAGAAMALSSLFVVSNSLRLKRFGTSTRSSTVSRTPALPAELDVAQGDPEAGHHTRGDRADRAVVRSL